MAYTQMVVEGLDRRTRGGTTYDYWGGAPAT